MWNALFGSHLTSDIVDVWTAPSSESAGSYTRALETNQGRDRIVASISPKVEGRIFFLEVRVLAGAPTPDILHIFSKMFHVQEDIGPFYRKALPDPVMNRIVHRFYGLKPTSPPTIFEMIVIAITEQQISLAAAATLRGRIVKRFGGKIVYDGQTYHCFPSARTLASCSLEELRTLSIPPRKASCIIEVAQIQETGRFDFEKLGCLPKNEAIEALVRINGIGPWSAEYILARGVGLLDTYPKNDFSVRRAVSHFYGSGRLLDSTRVDRILSKWHPLERYAEYYLLVAYELRNIPLPSDKCRLCSEERARPNGGH